MTKEKLNQLYRQKKTFEDYPEIKEKYLEMLKFIEDNILICNFNNSVDKNKKYFRTYDYAVLSATPELNFNDKIICDLGARDGYWGIYLTQFAKRVDISDYFKCWGTGELNGLNTFEDEIIRTNKIYNNIKGNKCELNIHNQDITNITYENNTYDIVLCTSVIEHMFTQCYEHNEYCGDIKGMKEIERICKPGGFVLISTDMSNTEIKSNELKRWKSGTYWYNEKDLFDRIINSTSLELFGEYDFSFDNPYNSHIDNVSYGLKVSPVILAFKKPN